MEYLLLLLGIACAAFGGELFIRGAVGIAYAARIKPAIIGVTIAAFATSSPELSIAINAGASQHSSIALGDTLGSNIVNVSFILAVALLISPISVSKSTTQRDFTLALFVPIVSAVLLLDNELSRFDGAILLTLFIGWLIAAIVEAKKDRKKTLHQENVQTLRKYVLPTLIGLVMLFAAGNFIVTSATTIAKSFGVNDFLIGATIVALGTSVPELASTIMAKIRGHNDMSLGTILGSNIFNGLLIVATAALLNPITITFQEVLPTIAFGIAVLLFSYPYRNNTITRLQGGLLLMLYFAYLGVMIWTQT
uniref:K+-dependent Na+/Ca+ exchanger related-protein n=1 Tax=Chlorobium chlorochromatii (strain CaD3) TaxID=340177 RepID=Q3AS12_CHLCH